MAAILQTGCTLASAPGRGFQESVVVTRGAIHAQCTPDPANFVRINGLHATLCRCLITGSRGNGFILEVRSASHRHLIRNTISIVCSAVGLTKLGRSRNPSVNNSFNPCIRSREGSVCLPCTRRLVGRKGTCHYFYAGRELRGLRSDINNNCSERYHGLPRRRVSELLTRNAPCMVHRGVPVRNDAAFASTIFNRVAISGDRLRSRVLVGASNCPACGFTGMVSSRAVNVARIIHNYRCLDSAPGCGLLCRTFK